jgi:uncharacterized protein
MKKDILYFEENGRGYTCLALKAAKERAVELGIKQVVFATTHGYTAIEAADIFRDSGIELIAVGLSFSCCYEGWDMSQCEREKIESSGIKVLIGHHGLSRGVAEAFEGNVSAAEIIARTFYCFSQGMKVAVEISIMAAEAGLIPVDREIIAVAGTGEGADTAVVITPAFAWKLKELKIHEIICKPRNP